MAQVFFYINVTLSVDRTVNTRDKNVGVDISRGHK